MAKYSDKHIIDLTESTLITNTLDYINKKKKKIQIIVIKLCIQINNY